jgi:hypothetical protein
MILAFEPLFSEGDHNHSMGENIEKCLIAVDLRPNRGGVGKNIFSVLLPTWRPAGRGRLCKRLIFGGPCRGRTYGPLIKSPAERLTQNTQDDLSPSNNEDEA